MHSHFSCEMPCQGHITSKFSLCIDTWYKSGYINLSYFARDWVFEGQWILRWKLSLCITRQHSVVGAEWQSTLHIRVVLSKKLNLHFLFLISSLGYKIKGISSKTCFLNIEKILEEIVWSLFWSQGSKNGIFIV